MKSIGYILFAVTMWGANFHLLKTVLTTVHFMEAGFWRFFIGLVTLLLLFRKNLYRIKQNLNNPSNLILSSILGVFGFNLLLFLGLQYTSSINASLIISLNPITTLIASKIAFKTSLRTMHVLGASLGCIGVLWLLSDGKINSILSLSLSGGDGMVLAATLSLSCYHVWTKKAVRNIPSSTFSILTHTISCFLFLMITPFFHHSSISSYPFSFWTAITIMGTLGTGIAYHFWNKAMQQMSPDKAGMFMSLIPLFTAFFSLLLQEEITHSHLISGSFILVGLLISNINLLPKTN